MASARANEMERKIEAVAQQNVNMQHSAISPEFHQRPCYLHHSRFCVFDNNRNIFLNTLATVNLHGKSQKKRKNEGKKKANGNKSYREEKRTQN